MVFLWSLDVGAWRFCLPYALENLNRQMQDNSAQSQQKLAATEAESQQQSELAGALRRQLERGEEATFAARRIEPDA